MNEITELIQSKKYDLAVQKVIDNTYNSQYWPAISEQNIPIYHKVIFGLEINAAECKKSDLHKALATLFSKIGEHNKAIENFEECLLINPDDSLTHYRLGDEYVCIQEYAKGLRSYETSISKGSLNTWCYLGAAKCATEMGDIALAEKYYQTSIDRNNNHLWAHYLFAKFLYELGRLEDAKSEFEKANTLNVDDNIIAGLISEKISSITEQIKNSSYNNLVNAIDEVLNLLRCSGKVIAHYTSVSTLKQIVFRNSAMRISEASYLNDPSEGELLWRYLDFPRTNPIIEKYQESLKEDEFRKKPFVLSFVRESRKNDLTLWRMYGKENGNEAAGCCIVYDQEKLLTNLSQAAVELNGIKGGSSNFEYIKEKCSIYQVAYIDAGNKIIIPECDEEIVAKLSEQLSQIIDILCEKKIDMTRIQQQIERISYLFKGREYSDEREVRLVMSPSWLNPVIDEVYDPPRVYLEINNITSCISEIMLGPKTDRKNSLLASMAYFLDKNMHSISLKYSSLKFS